MLAPKLLLYVFTAVSYRGWSLLEGFRPLLLDLYSPECVEGEFFELRVDGILRSSASFASTNVFTASLGEALRRETVVLLAHHFSVTSDRRRVEAADQRRRPSAPLPEKLGERHRAALQGGAVFLREASTFSLSTSMVPTTFRPARSTTGTMISERVEPKAVR